MGSRRAIQKQSNLSRRREPSRGCGNVRASRTLVLRDADVFFVSSCSSAKRLIFVCNVVLDWGRRNTKVARYLVGAEAVSKVRRSHRSSIEHPSWTLKYLHLPLEIDSRKMHLLLLENPLHSDYYPLHSFVESFLCCSYTCPFKGNFHEPSAVVSQIPIDTIPYSI